MEDFSKISTLFLQRHIITELSQGPLHEFWQATLPSNVILTKFSENILPLKQLSLKIKKHANTPYCILT